MKIFKIIVSMLAVLVIFSYSSLYISNNLVYLYLFLPSLALLVFVAFKYYKVRKIRSAQGYYEHVDKIRRLLAENPLKREELIAELKKKGFGYPYISDAYKRLITEQKLIQKIRK